MNQDVRKQQSFQAEHHHGLVFCFRNCESLDEIFRELAR